MSGTFLSVSPDTYRVQRIFSWSQCCKYIYELLPVLQWIPKYQWKKFIFIDFLAGITCAIMAVPQGLAYATIVGLPPVFGLYGAFFGPVAYFIFGSSPHLFLGPTSVISLLVGSAFKEGEGLSLEEYQEKIFVVTFFCGLINSLLGLAHLGFVSNFVSRPVITGFTCAASVLITAGQIPSLIGVSASGSSTVIFDVVKNIVDTIPQINLWCFTMGMVCIVFILSFRFFEKLKLVPTTLIAVVVCTLLSWIFDLQQYGVTVVGSSSSGLPPIVRLSSKSFSDAFDLLPLASLLGLVSFMEAFSIAKSFSIKDKYDINSNQEMFANGMANLIGSFFSCYPVTGSFARTAINFRMGSHSAFSSLIAGISVLLTMVFLMPLFTFLPQTVLAGIIIAPMITVFDYEEVIFLFRANKVDFFVFLVTFVVSLLMGIEIGLAIGVVLSILVLLVRLGRPHFSILGWHSILNLYVDVENYPQSTKKIDSADEIIAIRSNRALEFLNVSFFKDYICNLLNSIKDCRVIIVDIGNCSQIDSSTLEGILELDETLQKRNVSLLFANVQKHVYLQLEQGKIFSKMERSLFTESIPDAIKIAMDCKRFSSLHSGFKIDPINDTYSSNERLPLLPSSQNNAA